MPHLTVIVFVECGEYIWEYLGIKDTIKFSLLSRFMATIPMNSNAAFRLSQTRIVFVEFVQESLTLGSFRHQINQRLREGLSDSQKLIQRSEETQRNDDLIYKSKCKQFLQSFERSLQENSSSDEKIHRYLEMASFDEYDDFNPRHPQPKDKTHRRGDSYFNSDIDAHAQAISVDLQSIANLALSVENDLDDL